MNKKIEEGNNEINTKILDGNKDINNKIIEVDGKIDEERKKMYKMSSVALSIVSFVVGTIGLAVKIDNLKTLAIAFILFLGCMLIFCGLFLLVIDLFNTNKNIDKNKENAEIQKKKEKKEKFKNIIIPSTIVTVGFALVIIFTSLILI